MVQFRTVGDRSVALVLAVLGTLAFLSFVMAGVVGAWEKSEAPASSAQATAVPHKGA
jgi:Na+-transporting methylmalonyl-CoA/oxaloacetate decarboxylase gamma subunit